LQLQDLALDVHGNLFGEVPAGDGGGHVGDVAHLGGQVVSHQVHVVGQVLPRAGYPGNVRLAAEFPISTDLDRDPGHFRGETTKLFHHRVDGVLELENLAADIDGDLLGEVPGGDSGGDFSDVAYLGGQVGRHRVDAVGEVLPRAG